MRRGHAWVVAIALGALSACGSPGAAGSGGGAEARVATLTSAGPTTSAVSTRPRYRLDMTAEDEEALWAPYRRCLKEHGYTHLDAKIVQDAQAQRRPVDSKKAEQLRACEEKYLPLVEWEKDPANPKAADFARAVNQCLKARGITMRGDEIDKGEDVTKVLAATSDCERTVAAKAD